MSLIAALAMMNTAGYKPVNLHFMIFSDIKNLTSKLRTGKGLKTQQKKATNVRVAFF
jgi:hypothetical protein